MTGGCGGGALNRGGRGLIKFLCQKGGLTTRGASKGRGLNRGNTVINGSALH